MDEWYLTSIEFVGEAPTEDELEVLNRAFHALDGNWPRLRFWGMLDTPWKSPTICIQQVLNLLHTAGFPCTGHRYAAYKAGLCSRAGRESKDLWVDVSNLNSKKVSANSVPKEFVKALRGRIHVSAAPQHKDDFSGQDEFPWLHAS